MADNLGLVVETFHRSVMDRLYEVAEYIFFMASEYPRKVSYGFESGVGGPPEPLFKEFLGPPSVLIGPELSKGFFEQVGAVDSEVQFFQRG